MSVLNNLTGLGALKVIAAGVAVVAGGMILYQADLFSDKAESEQDTVDTAATEQPVQATGITQENNEVAVELDKEAQQAIEALIETEYEMKVLRSEQEKKKRNNKKHEIVVF